MIRLRARRRGISLHFSNAATLGAKSSHLGVFQVISIRDLLYLLDHHLPLPSRLKGKTLPRQFLPRRQQSLPFPGHSRLRGQFFPHPRLAEFTPLGPFTVLDLVCLGDS